MIFNSLELHPRCALGRFAELFPYAIAGFSFSWVMRECKTRVVRYVLIWLGVVLLVLPFILKFGEINLSCPGFGYQGLGLFCVTTGISILLILVGEGCRFKFENSVATMAGCTAGVYYIHLLVGKCMEIPFGRHRGCWEALAVGIVSLLVVWLMKRVKILSWLVK